MTNKILVVKGRDVFDISAYVQSIVWSGRKDSAARSLKICLIDHEKLMGERISIDVEEGHQCIFLHNDKEVFRGMFMHQEQNSKRLMTLTAYDNGIYLANNKDSFSYMNSSASYIFKDVCNRFKIPYTSVADTNYIIDELPKPMTTGYDVVCDALNATYMATGKRYSVICEGEALKLIRRTDNVIQWLIEPSSNLMNYTYNKSIEKIKTRIKLLGKDNYVAAQKINNDIEQKIGIFQEVASSGREIRPSKLNELINAMIQEKGEAERLLSVDCVGIPEIVSGLCVYVRISHLGLGGSFYVESDSHSFFDGRHEMSLKLKAVQKLDLY